MTHRALHRCAPLQRFRTTTEEVDPLPEPAASSGSRRASRAWDAPVRAPPVPPGARPPSRNAAHEDDQRLPFEDTDDEDGKSVDADEGFDYDPPSAAEEPADGGGPPPARPKREKGVDAMRALPSGPHTICGVHSDCFTALISEWFDVPSVGCTSAFGTLRLPR